jgi:poly-gamma-glutamate synthesis protein (capsule biosynthesis protein)
MTGRGIDQILPSAVDPLLHESFVTSASTYVELAEAKNGFIPRNVPLDYVWGDALSVLARFSPDVAIVNLETAVTTISEWWQGKGIHYRMHPDNVGVLNALGIDVCVLANNHVLDWGRAGLEETLAVLHGAGLKTVGAGRDRTAASGPVAIETRDGRVLVFGFASTDSGVPATWNATESESGVSLIPAPGKQSADAVAEHIRTWRRANDRVVLSIHWGGNWGYEIPRSHRDFAHRVIDSGMVDLIHGHSSHHPRGMEVYRNRLVLYGAGDFLNDYEGISGRDEYRGDLTLMYLVHLDSSGALDRLEMVPMQLRRFRLGAASPDDARWLAATLDRACRPLGTSIRVGANASLVLGA